VARIAAGQLRLDPGVDLAPKVAEVVGHLDRTLVRRQHLDPDRNAAVAEAEPALDAEELLDPGAQDRRALLRIGDPRAAAAGGGDAAADEAGRCPAADPIDRLPHSAARELHQDRG